MSIGNLKTDGGKGTNWPWQYRMLKGLQGIIDAITATAGGKEFEAELVSITCAGPVPPAGTVIRLEVRIFDTATGGFTNVSYYEPGSTTPDPADYSGCTKTYLEAGDATEATLLNIFSELQTVNNNLADIESNTADTKDALSEEGNTPVIVRATAAGQVTIASAVKSISFYNASATDTAHVLTVDLLPGETVNFDAGGNGNKFPASTFTYDPDTTGGGAGDLLIIHVE